MQPRMSYSLSRVPTRYFPKQQDMGMHSPNEATWLAALWQMSYDSHGTGSWSSEGEPWFLDILTPETIV